MPGTVYTQASRQVAQAFVNARKQAGLLQEELASRIGKDQSFISNIERGQRRIDVLELYAIARALGRDPTDLYRTLVAELPDNIDI
jgi:transcriptional regulator with XRE-family HTH domain